MLRRLFAIGLLSASVVGATALLTPASFAGKGKGGPPGGGIPPDCPCEAVIQPAPGVTCTLDWCVELVPGGFECGYTCTFPF